jgi:hypothetical protein
MMNRPAWISTPSSTTRRVQASAMTIRRVAEMLKDRYRGPWWPSLAHRAATDRTLAELELLLEQLQRHDERLSILSLALFAPKHPLLVN